MPPQPEGVGRAARSGGLRLRGIAGLGTRAAGWCATFLLVAGALLLGGLLPVGAALPAIATLLDERSIDLDTEGFAYRAGRQGVHLEAASLRLSGPGKVHAETVRANLGWADLFRGRAAAKRLSAERLDLDLRGLPRGDEESRGGNFAPLREALSEGRLGTLDLPRIDGILPSVRGPDVRLDNGSISSRAGGEGWQLHASLPLLIGERKTQSDLRLDTQSSGIIDLNLSTDGMPLAPLLRLGGAEGLRLDGEVAGQASLRIAADGSLGEGLVALSSPGGSGHLREHAFVFGSNSIKARLLPGEGAAELKELSYDIAGNRGNLTGRFAAQNLDDLNRLELDFAVSGEDVTVDLRDQLDQPLSIETIRASGRFDAAARRVALDRLASSFFGSALEGAMTLTFPEGFGGSPRLEVDARLPGPLTPDEVLAGWPKLLAGAARQWVANNLAEGTLTDLAYVADIPMNAIRPLTPLPDASMRFTFDARDAVVTYLPGLPPIRKLKASAEVTGNAFRVDASAGEVSGVALRDGTLVMPRFMPSGAIARFNAQLDGRIPTVLEALEEAGFVTFEEGAYQPEVFRGRGRFDLSVAWPLRATIEPGDVIVSGEGAFTRGAIDDVLPGIDAMDADGTVTLSPDFVRVEGQGLAASSPASFVWRQGLAKGATADLKVEADLDTLAGDMIGVPLRQFFRGRVATTVTADDLSPGAPVSIRGDIEDAAVTLEELGVSKARGTPGSFEAVVLLPEPRDRAERLINLPHLALFSDDFALEGGGLFTEEGAVRRLDLSRFEIRDRADLGLALTVSGEGLSAVVKGNSFTADRIIESLFSSSGAGGNLPGRSVMDVDLGEVRLRNGIVLQDLSMDAVHSGETFEHLELMAGLGEGEVMSATIDRPFGEEFGYVSLEATEFANLLNGVFGISSVSGAPGSLKGTVAPEKGFAGRLELGELIIKDAPFLALLLGATSLDGLSDVLNGDGIRFEKLEGDIWQKGSRIGFEDAKLVGSSLGISAAGQVDLDRGLIDMRGAIAPAYAVNGFLGAIPGLGRLFVSREGEGILAFSYQVTGSLDAPKVTVNALSALTPGILRRMFEPVTGGPGEPGAILDRAAGEVKDNP
jgi:hypothetical protein